MQVPAVFFHYEIDFLVSQEKSAENYQKIRFNTSKERAEWYNEAKYSRLTAEQEGKHGYFS